MRAGPHRRRSRAGEQGAQALAVGRVAQHHAELLLDAGVADPPVVGIEAPRHRRQLGLLERDLRRRRRRRAARRRRRRRPAAAPARRRRHCRSRRDWAARSRRRAPATMSSTWIAAEHLAGLDDAARACRRAPRRARCGRARARRCRRAGRCGPAGRSPASGPRRRPGGGCAPWSARPGSPRRPSRRRGRRRRRWCRDSPPRPAIRQRSRSASVMVEHRVARLVRRDRGQEMGRAGERSAGALASGRSRVEQMRLDALAGEPRLLLGAAGGAGDLPALGLQPPRQRQRGVAEPEHEQRGSSARAPPFAPHRPDRSRPPDGAPRGGEGLRGRAAARAPRPPSRGPAARGRRGAPRRPRRAPDRRCCRSRSARCARSGRGRCA